MYSNESTQLPLSGQITGKTVWYQRDIVYKLKPVKQVIAYSYFLTGWYFSSVSVRIEPNN